MSSMKRPKLGTLGTHSQGKISKDDQGDLRVAVYPDLAKRIVIVNFGTQLSWLGMDADTAKTVARSLLSAASALDVA